jgi:hypothetical protein
MAWGGCRSPPSKYGGGTGHPMAKGWLADHSPTTSGGRGGHGLG